MATTRVMEIRKIGADFDSFLEKKDLESALSYFHKDTEIQLMGLILKGLTGAEKFLKWIFDNLDEIRFYPLIIIRNKAAMSEKMLIKRPELNIRTVDQEIVIVDTDSGEVHQLNPTASYIWDLFDGNTSIEQAKELVSKDFDIDKEQASNDVIVIVEQLKTLNLLVESED